MVSPDPKIERYRDEEVQPTEDRYLRKEKTPERNFRDVADQVDEKRYREDEHKKLDKKSTDKKKSAATGRNELPDEQPPSIFDLVKNVKHYNPDKEDQENASPEIDMIDEEELLLKKKATIAKEQFEPVQQNAEFVPERNDLSYVNPQAQTTLPIQLNATPMKTTAPIQPVQDLQELFDRISKEVYSLELNGKSETIVNLKGPLFDQSRLILTGFDTAKGQFNITIDNLTQAAKNVLDFNQNSLIENLSKKGYMVHIVTTTTTLETPKIDQSQLTQEDSRQNNPDQDQNEKDQNKKKR